MHKVKPHILSLGTTLVVVAAIGLLSYRDWHTYDELALYAEHARTVVDQTQDLLSLLKDAETGQRGYLLTGEAEYLAPYQAALPKISARLDQLKGHAAETVSSQEALALERLTTEKLNEMAVTIGLRTAGDTPAALAEVHTNRGRSSMEQIRATAGRLIDAESAEFTAGRERARKRSTLTRVTVLGGAAILALLLLGAAIHVSRLVARLEESRLQEQNQKATLKTTLESIGDGVIATDPQGMINFVNPAAEQVTGWSTDEASGRSLSSVFRIISEESRAKVENPAEKVMRDGVVERLANHTLLLTHDGREVPIDDSVAPIRDRDGTITGVVLVFRDVSERRQAERDLAESENRYRLLFEKNPQPMWVYDQEDLRFLAVNHAATQSYGYTRDEFLAMTLLDIRPEEDIPKLLEVTAVPTTSLHTEGPWRHRKKDGKVIAVEITEHPLVFDGRSASLVLATDITERKRLEQQFYEAQRMESVGRLAGGVAHDFNNLLTVINGYSEMLMDDVSADSPLREPVTEIRAAGERAAGLTQQLLAFSRRQLVQPKVVNLNEVAGEIRKMMARLIGDDIELRTNLSPDLGNIVADAGQLQQIIMNLAVNARDAMPSGGTLSIETANVEIDGIATAAHPEMRAGRYAMLAVSDTGTGMTQEVQNRIFEPFFTTKPTGAGTGLGLATVYGMVKQAGGWIWVYSELGDGTTFKVYFPRSDSAATPVVVNAVRDVHGSETILVVEDQPEVRNLVVTVLRKCGYTVHCAVNGPDAIRLWQELPGTIDLLLTDIVMPGMTGRGVAEVLLQERPDLPVLYMSGYTEDAIARRGVLEDCIDYLQKPFTPELLALKVREVLGPAPASA